MSWALLQRWRGDLASLIDALGSDGPLGGGDARPIPDASIIRRVNSPDKADAAVFLRSGARDLFAIVDTLAEAVPADSGDGVGPARERPTVMELGCGVGRLLRHAPDRRLARVVATDVNAESLAWCRQNLGDIDYHQHAPRPPIATLASASVDIAYAHSVFTHIPLEDQAAWIDELARVIRPGGWAALTFLGREQQEDLLDAAQLRTVAEQGELQISPDVLPGHPHSVTYGAVCQTIPAQEQALGRRFDVVRRLERHRRQDVVVARRH